MAAVPPLPKSFEDTARHQSAVQEELERVCSSTHFRSSKRSCEFLQYIVKVALDGRLDSLKERSIGIDLFGRDASYEPSSDATVRVRANEVRKRLQSYYSSENSGEIGALRIDLPTGCYVPSFVPVTSRIHLKLGQPDSQPEPLLLTHPPSALTHAPALAAHSIPRQIVPPIQAHTLMRPALLALLVCILLLRHQLENREEYLRFWDHLLSGRSAMILSVSPQDRASLASSLYPLVWVAGRYGVDAAMQGDALTRSKPEVASSVQVSFAAPPEVAADRRLRWALASSSEPGLGPGSDTLSPRAHLLDRKLDRKSPAQISTANAYIVSAAVLTILPEDTSTLHIQGTDAEAIRHLLQDLTVDRNFPVGFVERIDKLYPLQLLVFHDPSGEWRRDIFWGNS